MGTINYKHPSLLANSVANGVMSSADKRAIDGIITRDLVWFGADPTGGSFCDEAWELANTWRAADPQHRSLHIPDGNFKFAQTHIITGHYVNIYGNGLSSRLEFSGGVSLDFFVFTGSMWGVTFRDIWISGGAACGKNALNFDEAFVEDFDINVSITGAWVALASADGGLSKGSAFQWGKCFRISNLLSGSPLDPHNYPQYGFRGLACYFNACESVRFEIWCATVDGVILHSMPDYPGGSYGTTFSGSAQGCGRGLWIYECAGYTFKNWSEESNALPSRIEKSGAAIFDMCGFGVLDVVDCSNIFMHYVGAQIRQSGTTYGVQLLNSGNSSENPVSRTNLSEISYSGFMCQGHQDKFPAGYGLTDPENIALNGDFSRMMRPENTNPPWTNRVWLSSGNFNSEQCGIGCADTTKSSNTRNCVLLSTASELPDSPWAMNLRITPALDSSLLYCMLVVQLKFKSVVGVLPGLVVGDGSDLVVGGYGGSVVCADGFTLQTVARRITAAMITNGVVLTVHGNNGESYYISEVSASIGYVAPRTFSRCASSPFYECELSTTGALAVFGTTAPSGANDPVGGMPWADGDESIVQDQVVETTSDGQSFITVGYKRMDGIWVPKQTLTGLVGV